MNTDRLTSVMNQNVYFWLLLLILQGNLMGACKHTGVYRDKIGTHLSYSNLFFSLWFCTLIYGPLLP